MGTAYSSSWNGHDFSFGSKRRNFDHGTKAKLMAWLGQVAYPSESQKADIMQDTGLSLKQVNDWYVLIISKIVEGLWLTLNF